METAAKSDGVLISADSDFARILAAGRLMTLSIILLREDKPYELRRLLDLLVRHLAEIQKAVSERSVMVFKGGRLRTRRLPISGK